jgi:RNA polymerase sigma-70 factor, ECF subfamily
MILMFLAGAIRMEIEVKLQHVARQDRSIFSDIYREWQPIFVRYATGILAGDKSAAEDVVDEAMLAIWQQADRYSGQGSAIGWMRRIVRNKAVDWLRKCKESNLGSATIIEGGSPQDDDAASPYFAAVQAMEALDLRQALEQLSFEQREAVWLCYFEERSMAEIAAIADCPQNTVKTRLFHARRILRKMVKV